MKKMLLIAFMSLTSFSFAATINCMDKALIENPDAYDNKAYTVISANTDTKVMKVIHVPENSTLEDAINDGLTQTFPIVRIQTDNGLPSLLRGHLEGSEGAQLILIMKDGASWIGDFEWLDYKSGQSQFANVLCSIQ